MGLRLVVEVKKKGDALTKPLVDAFLEDRDRLTISFEYLEEKKPTEARQ